MTIPIRRTRLILRPDKTRVLLRPFHPGDERRSRDIISRILLIPEKQITPLLDEIRREFAGRHQDLSGIFLKRFESIETLAPAGMVLSEKRKQLIGSYFLSEYSLESAALFNPSMVIHPDQDNLAEGSLRFILSLRATGEGHVSSITFRAGVIASNSQIEISQAAQFLSEARHVPNARYQKDLFVRKLAEIGLNGDHTHRVMDPLGQSFTQEELHSSLQTAKAHLGGDITQADLNEAQGIWMLARSNYEVQFRPEQTLSERVLFPASPSQRNGIEDARFVRFLDGEGTYIYYATFTAYDGRVVMPELVETSDFLSFRFVTLNGPAARNKGMALFPRRINGLYAMLSRQDKENIHLMYSDNIHFWNDHQVILKPKFPWELVQLGNCGPPIETDQGWLVLSHGVGAMRKYCIGAFLLDRDDPSKVIGRMTEPLLTPDEDEREGYVPNVVYSCGAIVHRGQLIIPYGLGDHSSSFVTAPLSTVLSAMKRS